MIASEKDARTAAATCDVADCIVKWHIWCLFMIPICSVALLQAFLYEIQRQQMSTQDDDAFREWSLAQVR